MSLLSEWVNSSQQQRQTAILTLLNSSWPPPIDYINLVRTHGHWGICASIGPNFNNAIFGRDSLVVAEDLLFTHQSLAHDILITLAKLQGHTFDLHTEEEPGKIHHEYRAQHLIDETTAIPISSLQRLVDLEESWGIQGHDYLIYYGSHDATPLFVRLLGKYIDTYGNDIVSESFVGRDSNTYTMLDSARAALAWIAIKIEASTSGLLEYRRLNQNALINQSWKDSATAYLHANGSLADGDKGIASVELQGYTYDGLMAGAKHFADSAKQRETWQTLAQQIQTRTITSLWMDNVHFFAEGLDHDVRGNTHQIDTLTSNGAVLLDSQLLSDLPDNQRQPLIDGVVRMIYSPEFVTDVGIRSRALRHYTIPSFIDYHGSFTVWPKETQAIAHGLRRHGYRQLAEQLENRLLRSVLLAGEFSELIYVETDGTVWYNLNAELEHFNAKSPGGNIPIPEPGQAWTISAVLNILANRRQPIISSASINTPEQNLLASLPVIAMPITLNDS